MSTTPSLYLAGGLFNAGERLHNLYLEKHLRNLGYVTILPQREALKFFSEGRFDIAGIVADCMQSCANPANLYVGNSDGADSDSGTAVEYGIAITATRAVIVYRTDFRTALENELGVNAMMRAEGTKLIYEPCFFTELDQVDAYYANLAQKIHLAVNEILR
ncbi:MAG: nucleoside 2-deoxyribosyltransferase [Parcubacteria group bacterium]